MSTIRVRRNLSWTNYYEKGKTVRRDFWNLKGYENEWGRFPRRMDFLNPTSSHYRIKRLQTEIYLSQILPFFKTGMRSTLDFGGGIGRFIPRLSSRTAHYDLVETCRENIHAAHQRFGSRKNVRFFWQTLESYSSPFQYQRILAIEILCYHRDPEKLIARIGSLCSPGGLVFISVENLQCAGQYYHSSRYPVPSSAFFHDLYSEKNDFYVRPARRRLLERCLVSSGFKIIRSGYLFEKLEGRSFCDLNVKKLKDQSYSRQIFNEENTLETSRAAAKNRRAIFLIAMKRA